VSRTRHHGRTATSAAVAATGRGETRLLILAAITMLLAVIMLLAGPAGAAAQTNAQAPMVTLDEARSRALRASPAAVAARAQRNAAGSERRAALTAIATPDLTATTSYTRFSEPFFNFGTGDISSNATSATIQANYTLLGGGKLGELRRSRAAVDHAEVSGAATEFRVALATDGAYFAVLADSELARVASDRLRRAEEQFAVARVRVQAGEAIATDSLQLLLEVNRARLAVLRSDSAVAVSRLRLGRQIGLAGPADAAPLDSAVPPPLPLTVEQAIAELRASGPDIEAARAGERSANAALASRREAYLPEISVGVTTGAYDAEMFPSAMRRSQVGFTVSLPIWNGGQRELAVARARAERDIARAERDDSERAAAEWMTEAVHGYSTSRAATELALVGVTVASETFAVQRARFREGATTILDLLEAQVALTEAEAELVQSRYATRLALARIEALLGRRLLE
jgi:outer membrane protein TolC